MLPAPVPVFRLTLFSTVTGPLKVIFLSLVVTSALREVAPLNVIPPLAVIGPLTAIDPVPVGGWIVVAVVEDLNTTPAGSTAIAPVPSARPIMSWENPFNIGDVTSSLLRFKRGSAVVPPTLIPKLGVSGCNWIVPVPLT